MTHIAVGPAVLVSDERHRNAEHGSKKPEKYSVWDVVPDNEATYLAFPTIAALVLVVLSSLSTPLIKGMSLADIKPKGDLGGGVIKFGAWGWCVSGVHGVE